MNLYFQELHARLFFSNVSAKEVEFVQSIYQTKKFSMERTATIDNSYGAEIIEVISERCVYGGFLFLIVITCL
jgi:hypothetical protein